MKYEDAHARAKTLIAASQMEGVSETDMAWLNAHLLECEPCTREQTAQQTAICALKSIPVATPVFLASRTKALVRSRVREMEEASQRLRLLVLSCVLTLATTLVTIPLAWKVFSWASGMGGVPHAITWSIALAWFWGVPGIVGAALLLTHRNGQPRAFRAAMTRRLGHE